MVSGFFVHYDLINFKTNSCYLELTICRAFFPLISHDGDYQTNNYVTIGCAFLYSKRVEMCII